MRSVAGRARTASTISGTAAVTLFSAARKNHHLAAGAVDLHARAVEFEFQGRFAELGRCAAATSSAVCASMGWTGTEELDIELRQRRGARFEHRSRHPADIAGHHGGAPHLVRRSARGFCQRFQHDAFERALADFAQQQGLEKALLGRGGCG